MSDTYYRYEDRRYASAYDGPSTLRVELRTFALIRRTPCGAWLDLGYGDRRWVADRARKRFACPTEPEARASFLARKRRQLSIYRARARQAEQAITEMKSIPPAVVDATVRGGDDGDTLTPMYTWRRP
jgi:hypothetical protein